VERVRHFLLVRHRHNWLLLFRFGLVGATGVVVNMVTIILCKKLGPDEDGVLINLPLSAFNVRWYHAYSTLAFLVANLWNFQLNRSWTFRSSKHAGWFKEYGPFLAVGLLGQAVGLAILTLLMHPGSIFALSPQIFNDSTGLRTRLYWAQLIVICIVTPLSFVLNKLWTFSAVRGRQPATQTSRVATRDKSDTHSPTLG
jgi:putative flippase GtrA